MPMPSTAARGSYTRTAFIIGTPPMTPSSPVSQHRTGILDRLLHRTNRKQMDPSVDALAELKALAGIITTSIATIEASLKENSLAYPSPRAVPFTPQSESGRNIPEVQLAGSNIVAAASQLISIVRPPPLTLIAYALQFHVSTALRIAIIAHTAEILRDAGAQGKHVQDIARPTNIDPAKLARVLRLLATNHVFIEVSPDVFATNRLSSIFDTGKSIEEIMAKPGKKYEGTIAFGALLEHFSDDALTSATSLPDVIVDPRDGLSNEPTTTAFNRAFKNDLPFFEWFDLPAQAARMARFSIAMDGATQMAVPDEIVQGFNWESYPEGSLVVDVGGGVGSQCLPLAKKYPQLSFVIQDRAPVIQEAVKFWSDVLPGHYKNGKVSLETHDFFTPQPVRKVSVFLLRMIMHDWSEEYCVKILRILRAVADESTKLLLVDNIVPYACNETQSKDIPGAERPLPPPPLLPNLGHAGIIAYYTDLNMMTLFNGQERTVLQLQALMKKSGWKLVEVYYGNPFSVGQSKAIGVPA
ncbi:S-adenosyl-L-methionine-dependent methyltransferase [Mycena metata]|uniref:S-adenosyl-L-methionine-dependent methyltransferase n=1 Tax=Mycena metata TaxID=1033252 RepID=A0AAD7HXW6_9AGAR|nr:S-adenosyl-L-methionine-dependent methyltransferase [Mycena metata]KAJ7730740.1 S-adenosyl-L-methionine-dependent methyltransferase [Mycena metata]